MSNQGGVQQAIRDQTGTALDYNGDWSALFDSDGIAAGDWNGRLLAWINTTLGTSYTEINGAKQAFAIDQGFTSWSAMNTVVLAVSLAATLANGETDVLALSFVDTFFLSDTGFYGSAFIVDTGTPANDYDNSQDTSLASLLTYTSPSPKNILHADGEYKYNAHNLYLNSDAPANQSITVKSGYTYAVTIEGSVSVTASGAATGTWTAGTNTFTAATTTLTLGSTSGTGHVQVYETPAAYVKLVTGASARYALPIEFDIAGDFLGLRPEITARTNLCAASLANNRSANLSAPKTTGQADPFGTTTAIRINELAVTNQWYLGDDADAIFALTSGTTYTQSVFIKKGTRRYAWTGAYFDAVGDVRAWFDFDTGAWATTVSAGLTRHTPVELSDGWWRLSVTYTPGANGNWYARYGHSAADGVASYAGATDQYWYAADLQFEVGATPSSHIRTRGSTATRAADVVGPALTIFPWNGGSGTYEVDGVSETPTDNGTILTLAPRSGETHIQSVLWVPA